MYKLEEKKKAEVLFKDLRNIMVLACMEGVMGEIYADDLKNPGTAAAMLGDFVFFAGKPCRDAIAHCVRMTGGAYCILVPPRGHIESGLWEQAIEDCFPGRYRKITRRAMVHKDIIENRDVSFLRDIFGTLPENTKLKAIDEEIYAKCLQEYWSRDLVGNYKSCEEFKRRGLGFVLIEDGEIVSGVSSYASWGKAVEIEADTREDRRRRGFAEIAAARFIWECCSRDIYPGWDAHSRASAELAKKLGYDEGYSYAAYEIMVK